MYTSFTYALRKEEISATPAHLLDLMEGIEQGLAPTLGDLFLLARATYVKKHRQEKAFQRAFFSYFLNIPTAKSIPLEQSIEQSTQFQQWVQQAEIPEHEPKVKYFIMVLFGDQPISLKSSLLKSSIPRPNIPNSHLSDLDSILDEFKKRMMQEKIQPHFDKNYQPAIKPKSILESNLNDTGGYTVAEDHKAELIDYGDISNKELEERLRKTLQAQQEKHEGGNQWIGQKGNSPFGHNGFSRYGIRIGGSSQNRAARHVIDTAGTSYGTGRKIKGYEDGTIQETLQQLKLVRVVENSSSTVLNLRKTIRQAGKKGYVQLHYEHQKKDQMHVITFIDSGGRSMNRHVAKVEELLAKMRSELKSLDTYYFHNCIYEHVFSNPLQQHPLSLETITSQPKETRIIIIGDASMDESREINLNTLGRVQKAFPYTAWLNPVPQELWDETASIKQIKTIFEMFPLTPPGLSKMVDYLTREIKK